MSEREPAEGLCLFDLCSKLFLGEFPSVVLVFALTLDAYKSPTLDTISPITSTPACG